MIAFMIRWLHPARRLTWYESDVLRATVTILRRQLDVRNETIVRLRRELKKETPR